ncbi:sugar nucleotide-binding protein [Leeia sp. TBRC 13508]|uniref:Sugar nucleotide-binding protein n=1 Tax=Leeia speluncae TaxID=2884804 RepID=A0ABS8D796_9NEIS|nr:NAD-dependent epimerase/dehydratase family protein [Leeia speluncae]MCB6183851.1 sugar nucleotide-binding protein [Leeia speluncae]
MPQPSRVMNKPLLLLVGAGDIAKRILPWLLTRFRVHVVVRREAQANSWQTAGALPIRVDLDLLPTQRRAIPRYAYILHFAPPNDTTGELDRRTQQLLAWIMHQPKQRNQASICNKNNILPQRLVYISTSGVYGDCQGNWVEESQMVNPQTLRAKRRLSAEKQLRAWGGVAARSVSILRVPGIYALDRLPLARLENQLPSLLESEDSYTNHIHADDLARIAAFALFRGKNRRIYHAVDDSDLKMGDYFEAVATYAQLPKPERVTREEASKRLSPVMMSYLNESRRLRNQRLKQELRVKLKFPTVASALNAPRH